MSAGWDLQAAMRAQTKDIRIQTMQIVQTPVRVGTKAKASQHRCRYCLVVLVELRQTAGAVDARRILAVVEAAISQLVGKVETNSTVSRLNLHANRSAVLVGMRSAHTRAMRS